MMMLVKKNAEGNRIGILVEKGSWVNEEETIDHSLR
jgi:hypothetical protein